MKRKIYWLIFILSLLFSLASCDKKEKPSEPVPSNQTIVDPVVPPAANPTKLDSPSLRVSEKTVSWDAVENASGYEVIVNDVLASTQTTTSFVLNETAVGEYVIVVKAKAKDDNYLDSNNSSSVKITISPAPVVLKEQTLWVVGDSTVCGYSPLDNYLYPRYGYGTQLGNYLSDKITVRNLALSGRSSKSFLTEANYTTLKNGIAEGDFLVVGFGHNDEKADDVERFASASEPTTQTGSFKNVLYEKYVKLATDKKATPILCSPIVRLDSNDNYDGASGHITANGDYANAIVELGQEKNVDVVNLRDITKKLYTTIGYEEATYFHAISKALNENYEPDLNSCDKTHINIYGAKMIAYEFACAISKSNSLLKSYVIEDLVKPTKAKDLVKNEAYVYTLYNSPNLSTYQPSDRFKMITDGWYGTAFGNMSGNSIAPFTAKENSDGTFTVSSTGSKGKFESKGDGIAYAFKQIAANKNFIITAKAKVIAKIGDKQGGFGLMLRDDCFIDVTSQNATLNSNFAAAGFITSSSSAANINFERRAANLIKGSSTCTNPEVGTEVLFKIERIGQKVICTTTINNQSYNTEFLDNPYTEVDTNYIYVGMFANRSANVLFSDVSLVITGDSLGA